MNWIFCENVFCLLLKTQTIGGFLQNKQEPDCMLTGSHLKPPFAGDRMTNRKEKGNHGFYSFLCK